MATSQSVTGLEKRWEREESRVVRPFLSAEDYLRDAALRLHVGDDFDPNPSIHIESIDRSRLSPAIRVAAPPKELEELVGVPSKELVLIVSIEDRVLKSTTIAHSVSLAQVADEIIELGDSALEYAGWSGDMRIHVAAVLGKDRKAALGLAYRVGSWIARKTFSITRARDSANFSITPVDEEWFKSRGLPPSTTYYVEMLSTDLNQPCDSMPDLVKVYLHQSVHTALARDEDTPVARALVKSIYTDVVSSILTVGFANLQADQLLPGSILDVVSGRLAKATGVSLEKLMQFAKDTGGTHLQAVIQAEAELTRAMVTASGRKMS